MANLNIFRIDPKKEDGLIKCLTEHNFDRAGSKKENGCEFAFYLSNPRHSHDISWGWLCSAFGYDVEEVFESPKAVLIIRKIAIPNKSVQHPMFAITFGVAFFYVEKYCEVRKFLTVRMRINFMPVKKERRIARNYQSKALRRSVQSTRLKVLQK